MSFVKTPNTFRRGNAATFNPATGKMEDAGMPAATFSTVLIKANNLSDLPNVALARTHLGLGTAAVADASTFEHGANKGQVNGYAALGPFGNLQLWPTGPINVGPALHDATSVFVATTGDDGTGTRGNRSLPFLTIAAAVAAAEPGDAVQIYPGIYQEDAGLDLSGDGTTGIHLVAAVASPNPFDINVLINSAARLTVVGCIVKPGNGSYIANLWINGSISATNYYQAPVGYIPSRGQTPFVNAVFFNLLLTADTDGIFGNIGTDPCAFTAYYVTIICKYDTANVSHMTSTVWWYCKLLTTGDSLAFAGNQSRGLLAWYSATFIRGLISVANGKQQTYGVVGQSGADIRLYESTVLSSSTYNAVTVEDINQNGGGTDITVLNCTGSGVGGALTGDSAGAAVPLGLTMPFPVLADAPGILGSVKVPGLTGTAPKYNRVEEILALLVGSKVTVDENGINSTNTNGIKINAINGGIQLNNNNGSVTTFGSTLDDGSGNAGIGGNAFINGYISAAWMALQTLLLADIQALIPSLTGGEVFNCSDACNPLPTPETTGTGSGCSVVYNPVTGTICYINTTTTATN